MKVLHVPYTYFPDPAGGTEVYVTSLAQELGARGVESVIAAPTVRSSAGEAYTHAGIRVRRFAVSDAPQDLDAIYGGGMPGSVEALMELVGAEQPDVAHLHSYSPAVNGHAAVAVRAMGVPLVVTYHTPAVTCQRGTLLRFGHVPCDGQLLVGRCASCVLHQNGIPRPVSDLLSHIPAITGRSLAAKGFVGGAWTALRMTQLMELRAADTRAYLDAADAIVAVASWVRDLLVLNGVAPERIALIRQGVPALASPRSVVREYAPTPNEPLRAVFVGRLDPIKGLELLLAAMRSAPDLSVKLDVLGSAGNDRQATKIRDMIRDMIATDPRVRLLPPVTHDRVVPLLSDYDVTIVPSQVLETGPLVVLESFAAGVPVLGSALGGIAELVRDGVDGRLVNGVGVGAWRDALRSIVSDRAAVTRWRANVVPPRTMSKISEEMESLYRRIVRHASAGKVSI